MDGQDRAVKRILSLASGVVIMLLLALLAWFIFVRSTAKEESARHTASTVAAERHAAGEKQSHQSTNQQSAEAKKQPAQPNETTAPPKHLTNVGPGDATMALFAVSSLLGALGHRYYRRLSARASASTGFHTS